MSPRWLLVMAIGAGAAADATALRPGCYRSIGGGWALVDGDRLLLQTGEGALVGAWALIADDAGLVGWRYGEATATRVEPDGAGFVVIAADGVRSTYAPDAAPPEPVGLAPYPPADAAPDDVRAAVAAELGERLGREQAAREAFIAAAGGRFDAATIAKPEVAALVAEMNEVDEDNRRWLDGEVRRHGVPVAATHGGAAEEATLLIALHNVHYLRFSATVLAALRAEQAAGRTAERTVAMLADRQALMTARPMEYGLQAAVGADGRSVMPVIADVAVLDANRERIGDPPMAIAVAMLGATPVHLDAAGRRVAPIQAAATGLAALDVAAAVRDPIAGLARAGEAEPALGAALAAADAGDAGALAAWARAVPRWQRDLIARVLLALGGGADGEATVCAHRTSYDGLIDGSPAGDDSALMLANTLAYALVAREVAPDAAELTRADALAAPLAELIERPGVDRSGFGQGVIDTIACVRFRQGRAAEAAALWRRVIALQGATVEPIYRRRLAAAEAGGPPERLPR